MVYILILTDPSTGEFQDIKAYSNQELALEAKQALSGNWKYYRFPIEGNEDDGVNASDCSGCNEPKEHCISDEIYGGDYN